MVSLSTTTITTSVNNKPICCADPEMAKRVYSYRDMFPITKTILKKKGIVPTPEMRIKQRIRIVRTIKTGWAVNCEQVLTDGKKMDSLLASSPTCYYRQTKQQDTEVFENGVGEKVM